jgi:hypothetical protein
MKVTIELSGTEACETLAVLRHANHLAPSADLEIIIDTIQLAYAAAERNPTNEEPFDGFRTDAEADADALASAGWGTDEDYCPSFETEMEEY